MQDVKLEYTKKNLKAKIDELETNSQTKNIRDMYRDVNDFKNAYQPGTNIVQDEKGDLVTDRHSVFWQSGGTIYPNHLIFMGLVMLGRHTYIPQRH
jgi:hypothetical protein